MIGVELIPSINKSNWTCPKPDTRVLFWFSVRLWKYRMKCDHLVRTEVINNSAGKVGRFRFHPIEWLRRMVCSDRPRVAASVDGSVA
jgi:hypothetical protein